MAIISIIYLLVNARTVLSERDLNRALLGFLDGASTGTGIHSAFNYGVGYSFGYLAIIYQLVPNYILTDPDGVIVLMNTIGAASAVAMVVLGYLAVSTVHGRTAAIAAVVLFALSPVMLVQSLSGHQILLGSALLFGAAGLLFQPVHGLRTAVWYALAALILTIGASVRVDVVFTFPWLVLTHPRGTNFRDFVLTSLLRLIPTTAAIGGMLLVRNVLVGADLARETSPGEFINQFYALGHVPAAIVAMVLSVGLATCLVLAPLLAGWTRRVWVSPVARNAFSDNSDLIGPLALALFGLVFWLPNPAPHRHFMFVAFGASILLARFLDDRWPARPERVLALALTIVVVDQMAVELSKLVMQGRSFGSYVNAPAAMRVSDRVPTGSILTERRALLLKRRTFADVGRSLTRSCRPNLVVISDEMHQLAAETYRGAHDVRLQRRDVGPFYGLLEEIGDRRILFLSMQESRSADPVATALNDPSLSDYDVFLDRLTAGPSVKAVIPKDRLANLDC